MKGILNIINNFVKKEKKVLGRWNIESCHKKNEQQGRYV